MFELPEYLNFAKQMNTALTGKTIKRGQLGNSPHKFVWYNRTNEEFEVLTAGKTVGEAHARGRWLFVPLEPGYVLLLGECGGKILYHPAGSKTPNKYHLYLEFDDGSFLTTMTQMWGAMELYAEGDELNREYVKGMRTTPIESGFSMDYFNALIDDVLAGPKRSVKGLLTQDQLIPGLGNSIAQDIMFAARLHPKRAIHELTPDECRTLHNAVVETVRTVTKQGGRYDEADLYGKPGGYVRIMDKEALKHPCPACGGEVEKIQYLGGACYLCPECQK